GDAISILPVLRAIKSLPTRPRIDIATTPGPAEVFNLCPHVDALRPHPLNVQDWRGYDAFASLEAVRQTGQAPGRSLPGTFAAALDLDPPEPVFDLAIPDPTDQSDAATGGPPLVAIAAGEGDAPRSYPHVLTVELVERLASSGIACILLGHADSSRPVREHPPFVTDMRGRTSSILELAVWMREMDTVVAVDSFIMHLAGALGRPTVALFAPTSPAHASPYAGTTTLASAAACAPCHAAGPACPKGFDRCRAWETGAVAPTAIHAAALESLDRAGRHSHFLENVRTSPIAA
ncbi:MAG: glycosyltransferase family 9 protein, partial [Planctomycetota bacterium]